MIKSYKCKDTRKLREEGLASKKLRPLAKVAMRKLDMLNAAPTIDALRVPPANRLEALKGDRLGQYSIRINDQFRVCFTWENGHAYNVEIVDYHK